MMADQTDQTAFSPTRYGTLGEIDHTKIDYNRQTDNFESSNIMQQDLAMPDNGCQCGPSCNCVYCTKHPTNPATRDRIGELYGIMDGQPPDDYNVQSRPTSSYDGAAMTPIRFEPPPESSSYPYPQGFNSGESHQQGIDQRDFFEMAYPISGCANGYCRCGDNCACVGCLTHTGHLPLPQT